MIKAVRIHENGGPEVLRSETIELAAPGPGQVRVRHTAIALNFSDVNVRRGGFYIAKPLQFPVILGNEAAGVVASVGPGVTDVKPGDRVGYVGTGGPFYEDTGSYAEERNVPASCLIKLPADISEKQAAAVLLKGLTAASIINKVFTPKAGDSVLIHAAASGVGMILCQWSKHLGATVIGTVGSAGKAALIKQNGADHAILYREVDFVRETRRILPQGVSAVFDGVGKDVFLASLDCLKPFGMLVNYGNASGHPPPLDILLLAKKGSLAVSRPGFSNYIPDRTTRDAACAELFDLVRRGVLKVDIGRTYPLAEAAAAHRDLEARKTAGSVLLLP